MSPSRQLNMLRWCCLRRIQRDGEQTFAYLAGKAQPERRPVVTGNKEGGVVEIKKGVSEADSVLLLGDGKADSARRRREQTND